MKIVLITLAAIFLAIFATILFLSDNPLVGFVCFICISFVPCVILWIAAKYEDS